MIVLFFFIMSLIASFKYKFIQFRAFKETKKILVDEKNKSSYSSFLVSLAAHIGTGNIVGISTALIYGGPGSLFWMWIFTVFSSIFSLMENTLAQIYKVKINGENRGGASFYIRMGFNNRFLATLFSVFFLLTNTVFFQPLQVNTISESLVHVFGINKLVLLIALFVFAYFVIFTGTARIVCFCERIVPIMSVGYIAVAVSVIFANISRFPAIFSMIIVTLSTQILVPGWATSSSSSVSNALPNEAGSAPFVHFNGDPKTAAQGFVQVIGVHGHDSNLQPDRFMLLIYGFDLSLYQGGLTFVLKGFWKIRNLSGVVFMLSFAIATVVSQFYRRKQFAVHVSEGKKKVFLFRIKSFFCSESRSASI